MQAAAVAVADTDLFGDPVPAPSTTTLVEMEGVLLDDAQVRMHASDHGSPRPVLHLHLNRVGPGMHDVFVEKPFDTTNRFVADALATRLKRGMHVRISASFAGARLTLPHAQTITPL